LLVVVHGTIVSLPLGDHGFMKHMNFVVGTNNTSVPEANKSSLVVDVRTKSLRGTDEFDAPCFRPYSIFFLASASWTSERTKNSQITIMTAGNSRPIAMAISLTVNFILNIFICFAGLFLPATSFSFPMVADGVPKCNSNQMISIW
jgi:hypothetical protein